MAAKVTNFGPPRKIPTYKGFFFVGHMSPVYVEDDRMIGDIQNFGKRDNSYLRIEMVDESLPSMSPMSKTDYLRFSINELRSIASDLGIRDTFFMRKSELIQKIGGKNGT